ncbi:MAG: CRISPR-associated protein Csx14 [Archaeoglobi archaeon]|nr:MAG: CRISPR-associated protein Csx14 [Archaeoglobi archaeon]
MKTAVIAPLGLSPPVVTSFLIGIGEKVTDLVLLTTESMDVRAGFELIKIGMSLKFPQTRVHEVVLPFEDVSTTEDNLKFMAICSKVIREEREKYGCEKILLNVAGGRKNMCITLSLLGQIMAVDGVYHVVSRDVKVVNQLLENLREDIRKIYDAKSDEEKLRIYREKERFFNSLLFPSPNEFEIVRIPTLPYPRDYLQRILVSLLQNMEALSLEDKLMLEKHGILERIGSRFALSEYGKRFVDVLLGR